MEGRTRGRVILCAAVLLATIASVGGAQQRGTFALLGGRPKIVSELRADHQQGLAVTLKVRQFEPGQKTAIDHYDVDMQMLMHMIVVRDDFATFAHVHPAFDAGTGTFSQPFTKQPHHRYYVYADSDPSGIGQQVFRFTLDSDGPLASSLPSLKPSSPYSKAGPYTVAFLKTTLPANTPVSAHLTVIEGDDPATDLVPYLGAAAHVVLIDTATLQYVHIHPTLRNDTKGARHSMQSMSSPGAMAAMTGPQKAGPFMQLDLPPLPPGVYKMWVQIAGGPSQKIYTAPFTLAVQ